MYRALNHELSWEEVGRIMTAVAVLGDERHDFNEWHKRNHAKITKMLEARRESNKVQTSEHVVTLEDYLNELKTNQTRLEELEEILQAHRAALAQGLGTEEGLLETDQAEFFQELAEIAKGQIERIEAVIVSNYEAQAAKLDDD